MMSRRRPCDGDSSPREALPGCCRPIGGQLAVHRVGKQLPVEDVARQLLLSRGQVIGLEEADLSPFYGRAYFLKALRKYMAWANMPADLLDADSEPDEVGMRMTLDCAALPPSTTSSISHRAIAAALVIGLAIGGAAYTSLFYSAPSPGVAAAEETEPLPSRPTAPVQPDRRAVASESTFAVAPVPPR